MNLRGGLGAGRWHHRDLLHIDFQFQFAAVLESNGAQLYAFPSKIMQHFVAILHQGLKLNEFLVDSKTGPLTLGWLCLDH